jgi:hypothetical protein
MPPLRANDGVQSLLGVPLTTGRDFAPARTYDGNTAALFSKLKTTDRMLI